MPTRLEEGIQELERRLQAMKRSVDRMLQDAVRAVVTQDQELAEEVIRYDDTVDEMELEIDELVLRLILHGPLATNLRFIVTALRINSDLERVGDQARNIAKHARTLALEPPLKPYVDLPRTAEHVAKMLDEAMAALLDRDAERARRILTQDQLVDEVYDQVHRELLTYMMSDPSTIQRALNILMIFRNLERIADHATNIAEDVIFIVEGAVVKHRY
ncbi:MAG: phosphate transport system regulatory protein PhoU [Candidatus Poribacteria bacterium]|nr:MAG: phosphate transport system regulatory protein PhoU [Candidatus Poribacteria bacterium]